MQPRWGLLHTLFVVGTAVAVGVVGALAARGFRAEPQNRAVWIWLGFVAILLAFVAVVGHGLTGRFDGALISERNLMSLARLQLVLWTVLILSAYVTAWLVNLARNVDDPLSVSIPEELWVAMGISVTSLLGSHLVLSQRTEGSDAEARRRTRDMLLKQRGQTMDSLPTVEQEDAVAGIVAGYDLRKRVVQKTEPAKASWGDMFRGDLTAGAAAVDITKVQMFFFTIVLVVGYGLGMADIFSSEAANDGIPALHELDPAFATLLALSHGGYLVRKALPDTTGTS